MKIMGIAGVKDKTKPDLVTLPKQTVKVAEIKKKLQAEGAFVYET
ncbi:MAG: hypothetical protein QME68_07070 [Elusimicrobiota bacterium]|nr:hypothetical protein [Elusimicrobiota bacterium]